MHRRRILFTDPSLILENDHVNSNTTRKLREAHHPTDSYFDSRSVESVEAPLPRSPRVFFSSPVARQRTRVHHLIVYWGAHAGGRPTQLEVGLVWS